MVLQVEPIFRAVEEIRNPTPPQSSPQLMGGGDAAGLSSPLSLDKERVGVRLSGGSRVILFSAKGKRFTQDDARRLTEYDQLILICGRYEGVDERVAEHIADEELSIGDFVLTGGELPAMIVVDAVARLLPEVLGNAESALTESHSEAGVLEYPQYTKPEEFNGWRVPEILLTGHHENVARWRRQNSNTTSPQPSPQPRRGGDATLL